MTQQRPLYRAFAVVVLAAGAAALAWQTWHMDLGHFTRESQANIVLWIAMTAVAAMTTIPLSRNRGTVGVTSALDFAALLIFGAPVATWFGALAGILANSAERWVPLADSFLRLGQMTLAVGLAGIVYEYAGGAAGGGFELGQDPPAPIVLAGLVHLGTRAIISGIGVLLATRKGRWTSLRDEVVFRSPFAVVLLPFGVLLAVTQLEIGPIGVALFLVPLLLARYLFRLWIESRRAHLDTVRTLMAAVDASDPFTRGHSYRIAKMCVALARHLGLPEKEVEEIEYAALLHDIGRTAIQHEVLMKPGKLTESEQSLFRAHPKVGHDVIRRFRHFDGAADVIYAHHEQPDGMGYPRGLSGHDIPIGSRIIMAVAAFDAMTSDRPYRRGLASEAAFEELLANSGTQFFPEVVEGLITLYSSGRLFSEFEEEELERYAREKCSSRALEEFLKAKGLKVPGKLPPPGPAMENDDDGVPVLEMPANEEPREMRKEFTLTGDGKWRLEVAAQSDMGCVRTNNEDSFGMKGWNDGSPGCLISLADGMGGAAAGEVASDLAVRTLERIFFDRARHLDPRESLLEALEEANRVIHDRSSSDQRLGGMGTTCTTLVFSGRDVYVGHVGDSRAYRVEDRHITVLTQDHTLAAELEHMVGPGAVAPEGATNVLTRCLGTKSRVEAEISQEPLKIEKGQSFVLCSDGLSNLVNPDEIRALVSRHSPQEACQKMVALARDRGGPDNITVQVARVLRS